MSIQSQLGDIADALLNISSAAGPTGATGATGPVGPQAFAFGSVTSATTGGVNAGSHNIASIAHVSTGIYLVTFTTPVTSAIVPVVSAVGGPASGIISTDLIDPTTMYVYAIENDGFTFKNEKWNLVVLGA